MTFPSRWNRTVDVSTPWRDESLPLPEKTSAIVAAFKRVFPESDSDGFAEMDLHDLLSDLADAGQADDVDFFDDVWAEIYDWADANRVWIETWGRPARATALTA